MAVQLSYAGTAKIQETLASGVDGAGTPTILHSSFDDQGTLTASTTPPVTKCVVKVIALVAGAATINLATITGTNGLAQDSTGLKVQYFRVKNLGAAAMTFTAGASEGYNLAGASFNMAILPGQWFIFFGNDATPDVAAADRQIDVAGTGTDTFELTLVTG
jgi:PKD repeat protein